MEDVSALAFQEALTIVTLHLQHSIAAQPTAEATGGQRSLARLALRSSACAALELLSPGALAPLQRMAHKMRQG